MPPENVISPLDRRPGTTPKVELEMGYPPTTAGGMITRADFEAWVVDFVGRLGPYEAMHRGADRKGGIHSIRFEKAVGKATRPLAWLFSTNAGRAVRAMVRKGVPGYRLMGTPKNMKG